jgi:hypothetical protein
LRCVVHDESLHACYIANLMLAGSHKQAFFQLNGYACCDGEVDNRMSRIGETGTQCYMFLKGLPK